MKFILINFLSKYPWIYKTILEICNSDNYEKILYLNHVKKGHTVFDIGANVGNFTILFSNIVGQKGKVFSFEAVPKTFEDLSKNVESLKTKNIILENLAVGDKQGNFNIYTPGNDSGQSSLKIQNIGSWKDCDIRKVTCSMVTLDKYIKKNDIERLDFMKCDIEGAELLALKGMTKILKKHRPKLLFEVNDKWTKSFGYTSHDLIIFLKEVGYKSFFKVDKRPILLSDHDLKNLHQSNDWLNIFCI